MPTARPFLNTSPIAALCLAALLLSACSEEVVEVYSVPKGSEIIASQIVGPAAAPAPPADFTPVWVVPEGWREVADNPPMRLATLVFDGPGGEVEVAITRFPGDVGGLLANVNRWRGQIGMEPVTAAELDELVEPFDSPGFTGHLLHLRGPAVHMLAASIFEPAADRTWFVRVLSDGETAEAVKDEVFAFARSFGAGGVQ